MVATEQRAKDSPRVRRLVATLIKELGYNAAAKEYAKGQHSAVETLEGLLNGRIWRETGPKADIIRTALVVARQEEL